MMSLTQWGWNALLGRGSAEFLSRQPFGPPMPIAENVENGKSSTATAMASLPNLPPDYRSAKLSFGDPAMGKAPSEPSAEERAWLLLDDGDKRPEASQH